MPSRDTVNEHRRKADLPILTKATFDEFVKMPEAEAEKIVEKRTLDIRSGLVDPNESRGELTSNPDYDAVVDPKDGQR